MKELEDFDTTERPKTQDVLLLSTVATDGDLNYDVDVLIETGDRHGEQGEWAKAERCYRQALIACLSERQAVIGGALGEALLQLGKLDEALDVLESALVSDPNRFSTLLSLGKALLFLKRPKEASQALARAVAIDGNHPEPHFRLGQALLSQGLIPPAEMAFRNVVHLRPQQSIAYEAIGRILIEMDRRGELCALLADWESAMPEDSRLIHARAAWSFAEVPSRASDDYVREVFDNFAENFEDTLKQLDYCAPQILIQILQTRGELSGRKIDVLDAGCGTGLCGPLLRPLAKHLVGVDLSGGMLERARYLGIYDDLTETELTQYLLAHPDSFDVVFSADTLVYFGDLAPVFQAAGLALRDAGILIFSLEQLDDATVAEDYRLGEHGRYAHRKAGVLQQLEAAGYCCLHLQSQSFRKEAGAPVPGLSVLARKRSNINLN